MMTQLSQTATKLAADSPLLLLLPKDASGHATPANAKAGVEMNLVLCKEIQEQVRSDSDGRTGFVSACSRPYRTNLSCKHSDSGTFLDELRLEAMLMRSAEKGENSMVLELFSRLRHQGCSLHPKVFVYVCKAHLYTPDFNRARTTQLHSLIHEAGYEDNVYVGTTLIRMYTKQGLMSEAQETFDNLTHPNVVTWTTLLQGYAEDGQAAQCIEMFCTMLNEGCIPNEMTLVAVLKACAALAMQRNTRDAAREWAKRLHSVASEAGCVSEMYVGSTLGDVYAKCGEIEEARSALDGVDDSWSVVSWTILISGYAENGEPATALELFQAMRREGCSPNGKTFAAVLAACGCLAALAYGKKVHKEIKAVEACEHETNVANALVDFYAKCGCMSEAEQVFYEQPNQDLVLWTSLLGGYSRNGDLKLLLKLFDQMCETGLKPDKVTFNCILTACSHAGLVELGKHYFFVMVSRFGIQPDLEHYTCMIDLLSRACKLGEAMDLLERMPWEPNVVTWMTILGASVKWKDVELGKLAFEAVLKLDKAHASAHSLMAKLYRSCEMWEEHAKLQGLIAKQKRCKKVPGKSWWTSDYGVVHTFLVGEDANPV